jgi:hypothetical protein
MLIYFYFGHLIWKDYSDNEMIKIMKNHIINDEKIPKILIQYLKIIKCLEFKETPNYDLIINIFKNELKEA